MEALEIVADPGTCFGKPRICGTRISLVFLAEVIEDWKWSDEEIHENYSFLPIEHIRQIRKIVSRPDRTWWEKTKYTKYVDLTRKVY